MPLCLLCVSLEREKETNRRGQGIRRRGWLEYELECIDIASEVDQSFEFVGRPEKNKSRLCGSEGNLMAEVRVQGRHVIPAVPLAAGRDKN